MALAGGLVLAGCGSGAASSTPASTSTTSTTPQGADAVQNLVVTPTVSAELVAAAAAEHGLPVRDYDGLEAGRTYYAYDPVGHLYWAGAGLVPSPSSFEAQVGVQDDGGYTLFTRPVGGAWTAYNDGLGTTEGASCSIVVPGAVRAVWGWSLTTPCGGPVVVGVQVAP